jgi:hypothetical protein
MGATFILLVRDGQEGTPRGRLVGSNDDLLYATEWHTSTRLAGEGNAELAKWDRANRG